MSENEAGHPRPAPSPERVTATRRDADLRHWGHHGHEARRSQLPPEPDPEWVTLTRNDANMLDAVRNSEPAPDSEPVILTEARGEAFQASATTPSPDLQRETAVRGEDAWDSAAVSTESRGEVDREVTRARGEQTHNAMDTGTFSRGETGPDLQSIAILGYDPYSTETKRDRGDSDFNAKLAYDHAYDDPDDTRRITALGIIAARQHAASRP